MGDKISREVQKDLLEQLSDAYPDLLNITVDLDIPDDRVMGVNLHYLIEQGLVAGAHDDDMILHMRRYNAKITARGLDFLAQDGGLGAILGVVTIKLHDDTIRQLVINRINADPNASADEKDVARSVVKKMSDKALGTLVEELTKKGLEHFPDLLPWITHAGHVALKAVGM